MMPNIDTGGHTVHGCTAGQQLYSYCVHTSTAVQLYVYLRVQLYLEYSKRKGVRAQSARSRELLQL